MRIILTELTQKTFDFAVKTLHDYYEINNDLDGEVEFEGITIVSMYSETSFNDDTYELYDGIITAYHKKTLDKYNIKIIR